MSVIDELIYDRTENDIYNDTEKAYIDYNDLNRIERAVKFISDLLNEYGYTNNTNNKIDWEMRDFRTKKQANRIKNNYINIKSAFDKFVVPDFEWSSIDEANDIERILWDINYKIGNIYNYSIHSGVANLGQNRIWQQRFRKGSSVARLNSKVDKYEQEWRTVTSPSVESPGLNDVSEFTKIASVINSWNDFLTNLDSEVGNIGDN